MYHTPNTFLREKKNRSPTTPSKLPQSFHVANPVGLAVHIFASPLRRQSACDPPFSRARIHSRDFFYFATREFVESCRRGEGYRVRERYMQLPRPTALFGRRPGLVRRGKTEVGAPMANHEPSLPNGLPDPLLLHLSKATLFRAPESTRTWGTAQPAAHPCRSSKWRRWRPRWWWCLVCEGSWM